MTEQYKLVGGITLNDQEIGLQLAQTNLPDDPDKRELCEAHMRDGKADDLLDSFWLQGCHLPESDAEDQNVYAQFSCKGLRTFSKSCRLTLTQYDADGNELTNGKIVK